MRSIAHILVLVSVALPGSAAAQGNDANTPSSSERGRPESIQLGAGSTSNVTTGFSGPKADPAKTVEPLTSRLPWPARSGPFSIPEALPIARPPKLRCEVIGDMNARARCERAGKERGE